MMSDLKSMDKLPDKPAVFDEASELLKAISGSHKGQPTNPSNRFLQVRELGHEPPLRLVRPFALALGAGATIYALDRPQPTTYRVTRFPRNGEGQPLAEVRHGPGDAQLLAPTSLAIDGDQHLYITDAGSGAVKKFAPDGTWVASFSTAGFDGSRFKGPRDVAVDASGNLHVADTNNDRLVKLTPDGELVWSLTSFTGPDGDSDQFYEPSSVCVCGKVVGVADTNENRVLLFEGKRLVRCFGSEHAFTFPTGVRLSGDGQLVHVADRGNSRVRRFELGGKQTGEVVLSERADSQGTVSGSGMEVDAEGQLILIQPLRESVVVVRFVPC